MDNLPAIQGEDPVFLEVVEAVSRLAMLDRPCLVVGERGTGKELLTSRLHYLSNRWEGPLVKVNCAALSESLLESELFGHEAGAFTGAQRRHAGRFERADGGTLVLDEIATASAAVQENVLRIIEYGEFERVGGQDTVSVDVRVIGSTNVDLPQLARQGRFRADLLDRLSFEVITVPPLRARPTDILALTQVFGVEMTRTLSREVYAGFSRRAEQALLDHDWPGNVRELKNVVERAVWRAASLDEPIQTLQIDPFQSRWRPDAKPYTPGNPDVPSQAAAPPTRTGEGFLAQVAKLERDLLSRALDTANWNQTEAANLLGLGYHQFRRLISKHDLRATSLR